jgi:hypothetical protein
MTGTETIIRTEMHKRGYHPLPVSGKIPPMERWPELAGAGLEQIETWPKEYPSCRNTGAFTRHNPTIDIDITDPAAAQAIEDLAREWFEEAGFFLVRVGQAPKRAVLLRTDAPFKKLKALFEAPNGTLHKIEILGDGQQVVVAGIHPDTRRPYTWHGGEPWSISSEDLPYISAERAQQFMAVAVEFLAVQFNYKPKGKAEGNGHDGNDGGNGRADWSALAENIINGIDLHDSIRDYAAALIGSGMPAHAVERTIKAMMNNCKAPHDERWSERYADIHRAVASAWEKFAAPERKTGEGITIEDFYAYLPQHVYLFVPTREPWPGESVNAVVPPVPRASGKPIAAGTWLDHNRAAAQMTWAPGEPMVIPDRLISNGGWIEHKGVLCFNLYRPPVIKPGDPTQVQPWLDHARKVFGDDAEHIIRWLAQRIQRPAEKINHALVLGGPMGIGKDTLLEPVKNAVGAWNFHEVSPQQIMGRFNGYLKSVILRVSEARDLGDSDRFAFYDHMKAYTAAPPDVLRVDEKNLREHSVPNCCGVIITTNHKADGIYLPADDRRHYVAWSDLHKEDFTKEYWNGIWGWYAAGGNHNVAAYLAQLDLSDFDPKAPPPKTAAFWDIVNAGRSPEDAELSDVLDVLGNPKAVTIADITRMAQDPFLTWITDRKNRRVIPHRLESAGYVPVRNEMDTHDGQWKINNKRQTIYAKATLPLRDRIEAAEALTKGKMTY